MIQLHDFVSETLKQIIHGVKDAQEACAETGADINPQGLRFMHEQIGDKQWDMRTDTFAYPVGFDVAVTVSEGSKGKGGAGIIIGPVTLGAVQQSEDMSSFISRIKFAVPVLYPPGGRLRQADGGPVTK